MSLGVVKGRQMAPEKFAHGRPTPTLGCPTDAGVPPWTPQTPSGHSQISTDAQRTPTDVHRRTTDVPPHPHPQRFSTALLGTSTTDGDVEQHVRGKTLRSLGRDIVFCCFLLIVGFSMNNNVFLMYY